MRFASVSGALLKSPPAAAPPAGAKDGPRRATARKGSEAKPQEGTAAEEEVRIPFLELVTRRPEALLSQVDRGAVLFVAGAVAGAIGKTVTAPFDRLKLLLQTKGGFQTGALAAAAKKGGLLGAFMAIGQQEGLMGYWRGNLPQVLRVLPYSAAQLCSYEAFKTVLRKEDGSLPLERKLMAGACAGMFSTLLTYPLDTLRLRMAVDPACLSVRGTLVTLWREGGMTALYRGCVPALFGIAPYMALELAAFDTMPQQIPSFLRGFAAALLATSFCYPLDTIRRQMQLAKSAPFLAVMGDIVRNEGVLGLYRGFLPNAVKNLPNKGIRLGTFDAAKTAIAVSGVAYADEVAKETERRRAAAKAGGKGKK
jgi:solute carrier family 25 (mitochondrial phosphate transporter), member 23/24/25/41